MECKLVSCQKEGGAFRVVLERNPFYPDGKGGQLGDRGSIAEAKVLEVKEDSLLLDRALEPGKAFSYYIDSERRRDIAQQHTAEHIFSAVVKKLFQANTTGFRMAEDYSTVDFDKQNFKEEDLLKIEEEVSKIIAANLPCEESFTTKSMAAKEDLRKPLSSKIGEEDEVRIIRIPSVDLCACSGFHIHSTLELSLFKIIHKEHIKGKYTRFYFLAGKRALKDYQKKHLITRQLSQDYSCPVEEILEMRAKEEEKQKLAARQHNKVLQDYAPLFLEKAEQKLEQLGEEKLLFLDASLALDAELEKLLLSKLSEKSYSAIFQHEDGYLFYSKQRNCKELIQDLCQAFPGLKGGGGKQRGQLKGDLEKEKLFSFLKGYESKLSER